MDRFLYDRDLRHERVKLGKIYFNEFKVTVRNISNVKIFLHVDFGRKINFRNRSFKMG